MADMKVCRICVQTDVKMYHIKQYELKIYYEKIMALKINEKDGLPWHFCYECAAMLHKFHKFKEKCSNGQKVLKELMWKVCPLTIKSICSIDRQTKQLQSSLSLITVNHRVRTYRIKSKEKLQKTNEQIENGPETVSLIDDDYVKVYDDNDELTPLPVEADVEEKIDDVEHVDVDEIKVEQQIENDPDTILATDNDDYEGGYNDKDEHTPLSTVVNVDEKIDDVEHVDIDEIKVELHIENDPETVLATDNDDDVGDYDDKDEHTQLSTVVDVDEKIDDIEHVDIEEIKVEQEIENDSETVLAADNQDYVGDDDKDELTLLLQVTPEVADVVEKIDHVQQIDADKLKVEENNGDEEKIPPTETDIHTEKLINDHDKLFTNDIDIIKIETSSIFTISISVEKEKQPRKSSKTKSKKDEKTDKKAKKFEVTNKRKTELNPNNWLKFNLTEEEAVEEFKSKAFHERFLSAKFKCNDCLKAFSKEDMLNRHVKLRHSESVGPLECRFCHMRFKRKCYLGTHMRQHYTKYKCLRCDLVCPLETTALFHEDYHNGVIRKCPHCGNEFKHLSTYYTHLRTHRSEHVCTLCGASFVSAVGLRLHKKNKHIETESEVTEGTKGEDVYCKRCDIKFGSKKAYDEHLMHSAKHADGVEDLDVHAPLGTTRDLKKRRIYHRSPRTIPMDCHICGKQFSTQAACRKHQRVDHPRAPLFPANERCTCEICGKSLAPGSIASHLNNHTKEKLYPCDTCGKEFTTKTGMVKHQLTHSSVKPAACKLCDKRFKQVSSLALHHRTFHLKQPYPKRNRKKKIDEISKFDDYPHSEDSEDNTTLDKWR